MKISQFILSAAVVPALSLSLPLSAQELTLEDTESRVGYSIGVNIGMGLANQGFAEDLSVDALILGLEDALGGELKLSQEEMMAAIQEFTMAQEAKQMEAIASASADQAEFLVQNAEAEGVMSTPSGLQYLVMEEGEAGGFSPAATDTVNVHYHGTLIDGTVFDSSVERGEPITFPLNGVIPGWTEGLQLMSVGDKFRFFIPSDLAYGPNGAGAVIGPNATLIFEVELLGIE